MGITPTFGPIDGAAAGPAFSHTPGMANGWMEPSAEDASSSAAIRPRPDSTMFCVPAASQQLLRTSSASAALRKGADRSFAHLTVQDLPRDVPPELQGVSVKELVKALGEWFVKDHFL